jgi:hypothetical protein
MSKDLVKKHSEGITHNTIGSIISTYLIQGTPAVIGLSTALLAYLRNGVPLYLVILIGSAVFFLLSFTWYYVAQRRRLGAAPEESSAEHLTGSRQLSDPSDGKLVLGGGAVDNSIDKRIETLNGQVISLNEEIGTLKDQHAEEIDGRRRAFEALRVKHDTLQERVEAWEKYTWLVGIAETQAEHIDQYVILDRIERGDIQLNDGVPFVKFGVWIANNSLFAVTLELESGDYIVFREQNLAYPVSVVSSNYVSAGRQREAHIGLVIEQRLSREEAHYISSSESREDAIFYLDRLKLTIKAERKQPPVEPKLLHINKGVTLHGEPITLSR